jgi:predicted CxxxxCH...CXXCH cytochrome family protein
MTNGTAGANNHFKALGTAAMEGPASDTVQPMGNRAYYQPAGQTCGTFTCHGQAHGNYAWKGGASHAVPFLGTSHYGVTAATFTTTCATCHADSGASSPMAAAPTCQTCHTGGSPTTIANCASCHTKPPAGTTFPNAAGKHAKHDALLGVTGTCATCHSGSDTGSQSHYDHANARPGKNALRVAPAPVATLATFNAKAGAASFNTTALTCSNTSCHGGITTPSWATGTIPSTTDAGCVQCHKLGTAQGVPENNSPYSGMHAFHLSAPVNAVCSECHGMTNGTAGANNHFKALGTAAMEGPASDTVQPMGNRAYYQPAGQTCGTFTCHGQAHGNYAWKGGASHAVPFLGTSHYGVTAATFTTTCATCHADSGTSPMSLAPTCQTCHTGGSPTAIANCASCHTKPPAGTTFPNVNGAHSVHNAFSGVTNNCATCHSGSDTGSTSHYDHANARPGKDALRVAPAPVATLSTFSAKTGAASFSTAAMTCSNVSCHGGQTTPNWRTGSIDVTTQCTSCHIMGTTQYNSYNSGEHNKHVNGEGYPCTYCHNMSNGKTGSNNHFSFLSTQAMEGPARDTIEFSAASGATGAKTYNPTTRQCTLTCHGQTHNPETW